MSVLTIENLSKSFQKHIILNKLNLTLNEGEVVCLMGPNGVGKTTLMKIICDLLEQDEGTIVLNGTDSKKNHESYVKNLSCIIENPALFEFLSGYENLKLTVNLNNSSKEQLDEIITFINLGTALHKKVKTYSLGMKQRLALGMTLLQNPKLLILDEPTNGLDLSGVLEFRKMILKLKNEHKMSILISTHITSDVEVLSDRILFLKDGELHPLESIQLNEQKRIIFLSSQSEKLYHQLSHFSELEQIELINLNKIEVKINKKHLSQFLQQLIELESYYDDFEILNKTLESVYKDFYEKKEGAE